MDLCTCQNENKTPLVLAMASIPMQPWETPYEPSKGLLQGTIFPSLDLPFYVTGGDSNG